MRTIAQAGGRSGAVRRRLLLTGALLFWGSLTGLAAGSGMAPALRHQVTVDEDDGIYTVAASFLVPHAPAAVLDVLTDYEEIPRFMPDIKRSVVRERHDSRVLVEQEAVSGVMIFSKRIHLLLEVHESPHAIRFRDASGRSFARYEGSWEFDEQDRGTVVTYRLTARPTFTVPEFMLKRVLQRDAQAMIDQLRTEVEARSRAVRGPELPSVR